MLAGSLCFMGLAARKPIRGALEVGWAVELNPGEIYGAALARAYELESEVAGYPRIVLGTELIKYLELHANNTASDPFSQNDGALAAVCLSMVSEDFDGVAIINYLGESFRKYISDQSHPQLYKMARQFVAGQLSVHHASGDSKLSDRYSRLSTYFASHSAAA